ncbi:MAG: histidine kinase, partial [Bacteroidales bacterium]|nr:histidine kinase [Bacteroidales bacterium]
QRRELVKRQIMELQLKAIKNQMDPHFTFNVFNTIAALIQQENPSIYKPFLIFTKLIHNTLESTDKIIMPLSLEIDFLRNYLDLELLRTPNKFDYFIDVSDEIDVNRKVPKMLLQIYVENAVKHGLRHKSDKGWLKVSVEQSDQSLKIEVTDNGIGRAKAKEISTDSTGFGLKIMENYFNLFNEFNNSKIQHEIIDLFDNENHPMGTKVRILIPLHFSYKFIGHGR